MKNDEEASELTGLRDEWLAHPYTEKWQATVAKHEAKALQSLKAACAETTDPKVARAYEEYLGKATLTVWLRKGIPQ